MNQTKPELLVCHTGTFDFRDLTVLLLHMDMRAYVGSIRALTHFLATPLGTKDTGFIKPNRRFHNMSSEILPSNIVIPSLEELPKEARKALLERQMALEEQYKARKD